MTTGTVKKVVADRGFGFIAAEDEKEYFFHRGALDSSLDFDRLVGGERVSVRDRAEPQGSAGCPGEGRLAPHGAPITRWARRPLGDPGASIGRLIAPPPVVDDQQPRIRPP